MEGRRYHIFWNRRSKKKEAIQQIAEELDARTEEMPSDDTLHVDDYVVPVSDDCGKKEPPQIVPEEEPDPFAVLDNGLPEPEPEEDDFLRTEIKRDRS